MFERATIERATLGLLFTLIVMTVFSIPQVVDAFANPGQLDPLCTRYFPEIVSE